MNKKTVLIATCSLLIANAVFGQTRVAVQTFSNGRGIALESAKTVTNLVIGRLVGIVEVYDRDSFDKIVAEHKFQASDWASKEQMAKLGAAVGVSYIIRGDMDTVDGVIFVTARMIDINTAQVVASGDAEFARLSEARDKIPQLTDGIIETLTKTRRTVTQPRTQGATGAAVGIEVIAITGGAVWFQDKEVAVLWGDDSVVIPVDRPGTYQVKFVTSDGKTLTRSVSIAGRGVKQEYFPGMPPSIIRERLGKGESVIGQRGPGGGIIYKAENGRGMEVSPYLGYTNWSSAHNLANNYRGGGFSDWYLPSRDELNSVYQAIGKGGVDDFSNGSGDTWHWSSSEHDYSTAWAQRFSDGYQADSHKYHAYCVRAVRAFNY